MDHHRCESLNEYLYEPRFQNIVQGVHALNTARKSFRDLIEKQWKHFIARLPDKEKEQLGTLIRCLNHHGLKLYSRHLCCGHENCELLYTRLRKLAYGTEDISDEQDRESVLQGSQKNFSYKNSCFNFIWDLASCFNGVKSHDVKSHGRELNAKTLINLMKNCKMFAFKDSERIYSQVLEDVDKLIYAKDLLISNEDLKVLFDHLLELLSHWQHNCQSCSYGVTDIKKIRHGNADCENLEYKLLVRNVLKIIKGMLNDSESDLPANIKSQDVSSSKKLISSLHSQAEEMISVQEPDELLEIQQEIESLEEEKKQMQTQIVIEKSKEKAKMKEIIELEDKLKRLEDIERNYTLSAQVNNEVSDTRQELLKENNLKLQMEIYKKKCSELSDTEKENERLKEYDLKLQMEIDKLKSKEVAKKKEKMELQMMKQLDAELEKQKTISTQAQSELSDTKQESKRLKDDKLNLQTEIDEMKSSKDDEISINKELQLKLKNLESDLERQKMLSIQAQSELSNTKQENKRLEDDNLKLQMEVNKMKSSKDQEITINKELQLKLQNLETDLELQKSSKYDEISINKELQLKLKNLESDLERQKSSKDEEITINKELQLKVKTLETVLELQLSTQTQSVLSDTKQENKRLKDEIFKLQTEIDIMRYGQESEIQGKEELQENVHRCLKMLTMYNSWKTWFHHDNISSLGERLSPNRFQVVSFGSFQDVVLMIDGLIILFDPYDTKLMEDENEKFNCIIDNINNFEVDIVALSACVYSFSDSTVRKIVRKNRNVKWIIPLERKDWLISLGVEITSITVFAYWDEKILNIQHQNVSFVCTPTYRNRVSSGSKLCNACGWIVKGSTRTFYSAGFTNYNETIFSRVKERHGPIHSALLPIVDEIMSMSCLPEFRVEIDEIIEMHKRLQPCTSLGIEAWGFRNDSFENKELLEEKMRTLNLDCQQFHFLKPDDPYEIDNSNNKKDYKHCLDHGNYSSYRKKLNHQTGEIEL